MNTNNVFLANVYRLVDEKETDNTGIVNRNFCYSRSTIVYACNNGKFYDLQTRRRLRHSRCYKLHIGDECIDLEQLENFKELFYSEKYNLSKRKIKKLYIEHKNNSNNK